ncbi:MAG: hypothetical protein AMK73_02565 [Planctomycetes bacterium SM23_32]|nr:MAG: hypothetical protein AMK73_02565 [Planctomycetes bacterium SM23_32]
MGPPDKSCAAAGWPLLPVLALLLWGAGCHYPAPIQTYEYVTSYERMSDGYDPMLSLAYVPDATSFSRYRGIVVGDVGVGRGWIESREEALGFATFFRVILKSKLQQLGKFDIVALGPPGTDGVGPLGDDVLLMEGMITRFHTGSGLLRYLSYMLIFLQAGATDLQIEGHLIEPESGRLVMEFVDRRRHFCNTPFGPNPRNFHKGFAMKVTATETAQCLTDFIAMHYEGLPVIAAGVLRPEPPASTH